MQQWMWMTNCEVSTFGITTLEDKMLIHDIGLVEQEVTMGSVDLSNLTEYCFEQAQLGRQPEQFFRHWIHTHPDIGPQPSSVDVQQFKDLRNDQPWASMIILDKGGTNSAQIGNQKNIFGISLSIDWSVIQQDTLDLEQLREEFNQKVTEKHYGFFSQKGPSGFVPRKKNRKRRRKGRRRR